MTPPLGVFDLFDRQTGRFEEAYLFSPIGEKHLADFEASWRPKFEARRAQVQSHAEASAANLEDSHWNWRVLVQSASGRLEFQTFALECGTETQGLMFVKTTARAREQSQKNQHLIYIDRLATAPWNRPGLMPQPRYKGVGRLMLAAAISLSLEEEFKGRIGLHSLPRAESWYRDVCGMTDLGLDEEYPGRLRYFEMTEQQAQAFLAESA